MILIHRICIALSGFGNFMSVEIVMSDSAAMLLKQSKESVKSEDHYVQKGA